MKSPKQRYRMLRAMTPVINERSDANRGNSLRENRLSRQIERKWFHPTRMSQPAVREMKNEGSQYTIKQKVCEVRDPPIAKNRVLLAERCQPLERNIDRH